MSEPRTVTYECGCSAAGHNVASKCPMCGTPVRPDADPSGWRTIESAPKNGDWLIMWAPGWTPVTASWCHMPPLDLGPGWYVGGGQWIKPTHWQPLPPPPEQES